MLPDSTQEIKSAGKSERSSSSSNKLKSRNDGKGKKVLKKRKPKRANEDDNFDFNRKIYPIRHYIKDRKEMVEQMFSTLKSDKITAILPVILKKYTLEELKTLCVEHLEIMSRKRILQLLDGKNNKNISSSSTEDSSENDSGYRTKNALDNSDQPPDSTSTELVLPDETAQISSLELNVSESASTTESQSSAVAKTKLEILELELRARAIKKLLQRPKQLANMGVESTTNDVPQLLEGETTPVKPKSSQDTHH